MSLIVPAIARSASSFGNEANIQAAAGPLQSVATGSFRVG